MAAGTPRDGFDSVRAAATQHASCPICLESLLSRPDEVGALTAKGRRVEQALYHRSCVGIRATGGLPRLPGSCSPITRAWVDGFELMPPLSNRERWLRFVDWNGDGAISIAELSSVVAAMLPVDENSLEKFLRENFEIPDGAEMIPEHVLTNKILPHLEFHAAEVTVAAPTASIPCLGRTSTRAELLAWFKYWDADGSGSLDVEELRYALAVLFFRAFGNADMDTKQAIVEAFLAELNLKSGEVSKSNFLDELVPALQANLPLAPVPDASMNEGVNGCSGGEARSVRVRLLLHPTGVSVDWHLTPSSATIGDLRREAAQRLGPAAVSGTAAAVVEVFLAGRRLDGPDSVLLYTVAPRLEDGCVFQVILRSVQEETDRVQRARDEISREREALRREREDFERQRREQVPGTAPQPTSVLQPGTRVTLRNLRSAPELNGRSGIIIRLDESSGRYVVDVAGPGGGHKTLRLEALVVQNGRFASLLSSARGVLGRICARVQMWAEGYEWWHLLLGAFVVLLFAYTFADVNGRYSASDTKVRRPRTGVTSNYDADSGAWRTRDQDSARAHDYGRTYDERSSPTGEGRGKHGGPSQSWEQRRPHRHHHHHHHGRRSQHDDDYDVGTDYGQGPSGGGLLGNMDQTTTLLLLAGFAFLCWKGIIPIQNLDFWQCIMLWQMVEPLLYGRRRRGVGMGTFGGGFGGLGGFSHGPFGGMHFGRRWF